MSEPKIEMQHETGGYGAIYDKIFLLDDKTYRRNDDVIPTANNYWWTATPFSIKEQLCSQSRLVCEYSAIGEINANNKFGVRPACYLKSDIVISDDGISAKRAGEIVKELAETLPPMNVSEDVFKAAAAAMLGTLAASSKKKEGEDNE